MYNLFRPALFALDPERAHDLTLASLARTSQSRFLLRSLSQLFADRVPELPVECMGLEFKHPVGLAAGLDKDARALAAFSALGFSSVECGTVTPKPQGGNDKPRIFRLIEDEGLINRLGFNSAGMDVFLRNIAKQKSESIIGINVGKNAKTELVDAHHDYTHAIQRAYGHADYLTVNISSPNTKSLRDLQDQNYLDDLLFKLQNIRKKCEKVHKRKVPMALKVAPDLDGDEIEVISELLLSHQVDALIATNTTISRPESLRSSHRNQDGGLSGAPVKELSTHCIAQFYSHLNGRVPIIGVGGIKSVDDAWDKLLAGADLLQIYTQFIYQGPEIIRNIVTGLQKRIESQGFSDLKSALGALRVQ